MSPLQAIIFDLDGTLVDTEPLANQAWELACQDSQLLCPADLPTRLYGVGGHSAMIDILRSEWPISNKQAIEIINRAGEHYTLLLDTKPPLTTGALALLDLLESLGIRKALSSSSTRQWVHKVLDFHALSPRFEYIITADDLQNLKPHPDAYATPVKLLGLSPDDCVAIEDSPTGVTSAKLAGLSTIAVSSPFVHQEAMRHADCYVDGLHKINRQFLDTLHRQPSHPSNPS